MMTVLFWILIGLMTLIAVAIIAFPVRRKHKFLSMMFVIALPIVGLTLYWYLGSSQKLEQYWTLKKEAKQVKLELSKIKSPMQVVDRMKAYLHSHPNSPKGWYLLGKVYFGQRQYSEALAALQKAHKQKPSSTQYAVSYAQASYFQNSQQLRPSVLNMLKRIVIKEPHNVGAINLLAINFYLEKDYKNAVQYWEKLLPLFVAGSPDQKILLSMIASAQKKSEKNHLRR